MTKYNAFCLLFHPPLSTIAVQPAPSRLYHVDNESYRILLEDCSNIVLCLLISLQLRFAMKQTAHNFNVSRFEHGARSLSIANKCISLQGTQARETEVDTK